MSAGMDILGFPAVAITDSTSAGRAVLTAVDAAAQRTSLGLGTVATLAVDTDGTLAANSDAVIASQKAVRTYADTLVAAVAAGLKWKTSVVAATTANGTLASAFANGQTIDGVTLATGQRILLKNQSSGAENGIYIVAASGAPARATDADAGSELVSAAVFVEQGTTNADRAFVCTNNSITLGSTSVVFTAFASVIGALIASNNLSDVGNAGTARTNLGVGTGDSPQFSAVNVGHASDTTIARDSAGRLTCEGFSVPVVLGSSQVDTAEQIGVGGGDMATTQHISFTLAAARLVEITACARFTHATATALGGIVIDVNGVDSVYNTTMNDTATAPVTYGVTRLESLSAGSHTIKLQFSNNVAGLMTASLRSIVVKGL